ncbi:MAG: superoxide dismutase family protein [Pedosphaera sp.]|nr:superoxide dismutase family protein [Pedosphaera sp.]MST01025.1 superoxide dismutase family protein [Pedosphaera sp.]
MKLIPIITLAAFTFTAQLHAAEKHGDAHASAWTGVKQLVAVLQSTAGNKCKGTVRFIQEGEKIKIVAEVEGLTPNQKHAMHIHEFGDSTSADGTSAGGHYNPEKHDHGLPTGHKRHAGDLGNLQADANGKAKYEIVVDNVTLAGLKNPVIGRGVIVHAKPDDGGQPVGNAGPRIACGVIGIAQVAPPATKK